jgi:hypothetical protein
MTAEFQRLFDSSKDPSTYSIFKLPHPRHHTASAILDQRVLYYLLVVLGRIRMVFESLIIDKPQFFFSTAHYPAQVVSPSAREEPLMCPTFQQTDTCYDPSVAMDSRWRPTTELAAGHIARINSNDSTERNYDCKVVLTNQSSIDSLHQSGTSTNREWQCVPR